MAEIKRIWRDSKPPKPDVYLTRRGNTKHTTVRFWDGVEWWALRFEPFGRVPKNAFSIPWNRKSYEPVTSFKWAWKYSHWSRKITDQAGMKWGERYWHYSDTEILNSLIQDGTLHPRVRDAVINDLNGRPVL